jgi:DNA-binding response OmpR family regulator
MRSGAAQGSRGFRKVGRVAEHPAAAVLVVTDDPQFGLACVQALELEGFSATYARHSGHALLACLRGVPVDVLVAELSMPDGSGPSLASRLRRYHPGLKTLYLADPGRVDDADNVLVRPFTGEELLGRVRACVTSSPAS